MITLITVTWSNRRRDESEQMIMLTEDYKRFSSILTNCLNCLTWWDFDGKHGHVESVMDTTELNLKEAIKLYNQGDLENTLQECIDALEDMLSDEDYNSIFESEKNAYKQIIQQNTLMNVEFDLDGCEDKDKFLLRLSQLCDFYSVKMSDKN